MIADRLEIARQLVVDAGRLLLASNASAANGAQALERAIEQTMRDAIAANFPDDDVVGEEFGGSTGEVTWVIDPLDGTANFQRGLPLWCIMVALVVNGETLAGLVYHPPSGELFLALRGKGAFAGERRLRLDDKASPKQPVVEIGWDQNRDPEPYCRAQGNLLASNGMPVSFGTAGLSLAWVASGRIDAYVDEATMVWDGMAGSLLVRESGGVTNDFLENALATRSAPLLACAKHARYVGKSLLRILTSRA